MECAKMKNPIIQFFDTVIDNFFHEFDVAFGNKSRFSQELREEPQKSDAIRRVQEEISRLNTFKSAASGVTVSENKKAKKNGSHEIYVTVNTPKITKDGGYTPPKKEAVVIDISTPETVEIGIECLRDKFISAGKIEAEVAQKIHQGTAAPSFGFF